jgi:hypothetical protein
LAAWHFFFLLFFFLPMNKKEEKKSSMHWLWKPENSEKPFSVCDFTAHICAFCVCVCIFSSAC